MNPALKHLGDAIASRRDELGISQQRLHEIGGPSDTTVSKIEGGIGPNPSAPTLRRLDTALGWTEGSSRRTLDGGSPTVADPTIAQEQPDLEQQLRHLRAEVRELALRVTKLEGES